MSCKFVRSSVPLSALFFCVVFSGTPASAPSFSNEHLRYSINWPSGLSLGEGDLSASRSVAAHDAPARLDLAFNLDAGIPGFSVTDRYHSAASPDFCSVEFQKKLAHGKKTADETTRFDNEAQTATRETEGGGKSDMKMSSCGKDALTYLYFVRHELSQGRLPPTQTVFFGAPYQVHLEFGGTMNIKLSEKSIEADKILASLKGPSSDINFEVYFLKDQARTPVLVKVPLALGTFSMELVREP
jgi:hypothetical protein